MLLTNLADTEVFLQCLNIFTTFRWFREYSTPITLLIAGLVLCISQYDQRQHFLHLCSIAKTTMLFSHERSGFNDCVMRKQPPSMISGYIAGQSAITAVGQSTTKRQILAFGALLMRLRVLP